MLYIISEDQGAGMQFWEAVKSELLDGNDNVSVITSKGIRNIRRVIGQLKLLPGDTLLLAIDMVTDNASVPIAETIDTAIAICTKIGARLLCTTYYCFEEIFISYRYLAEILKHSTPADIHCMIQELQTAILEGRNYALYPDKYTRRFINNIRETLGREKLAKLILSVITSETNGRFRITSGKLGSCWVADCTKVRANTSIQHSKALCRECNFRCKEASGKQKLQHLEENSLFSYAGKLGISSLIAYIN